jgi:hypothetical protein
MASEFRTFRRTKDEIAATAIARAFVEAVERLEAFQGDPAMVYDDLLVCASRKDKRVRDTVSDIYDILSGAAMNDEDAG